MTTQKYAAILGVATVVPEVCVKPDEYVSFIQRLLELTDAQTAIVRRFVERSEIKKRYSIIQDYLKHESDWTFFNPARPRVLPDTQQRNDLYKQEAPKLAYQAAHKLLQQWGGQRSDITHIIFISCTGLFAPGIEFLLLNELGLSPTTQRIALNFMGCFGTFRALAIANAIALQDPAHRILIVSTELCSLHIQPDLQIDTLVGNALFADGAAAMLVGAQPTKNEKPLWEIVRCASMAIENSPDAMRWDVTNRGFVMRLSHEVPGYIRSKIRSFVTGLIGSDCNFEQSYWAIHPGGKAILQAIEQECNLERQQTESSWQVMADYGNMSSATIQFVFDHLSTRQQFPWTIAVGFGPGLSVEGVLLKSSSCT